MTDPVTAADGHTYDRIQIERWLSTGRHNSPVTGAPMSSTSVVDNVALRKIIREWAEQVVAYVREEVGGPCVVVGQSNLCAVALEAADMSGADGPVKGVVLVGPPAVEALPPRSGALR